MNSKIKNYVDVLFNDIPNSRKAAELKEEILSNLNEHFEALIKEGKSENQAYTEALASLGDVDELLKSIMPDKDSTIRINEYKQKRAKITSVSVSLYILGVVFLCSLPAINAVTGSGKEELMGILGLAIFLVFSAIATGLIIYVNMSIPQDIEPFISRGRKHSREEQYDTSTSSGRFWAAFHKVYWLLVIVIYFLVSFTTNAWHITWLIFLIGTALRQAISAFTGLQSDKREEKKNE